MAAVLAKVQKEVGPEAKISSAQRVRSGGVMGFFQREKFEILVEIPDAETAPAPSPTPPAAQGTPRINTIAPPTPTPEAPKSLLELANQVNRDERPAIVDKPVEQHVDVDDEDDINNPIISTESNSFAEILSRIAFQSDMGTNKAEPTPTPTHVVDVEPEPELEQQPEPEPVAGFEELTVSEIPVVEPNPEPEPMLEAEAEPEPEPEPIVELREPEPAPHVAETPFIEGRPAFLDTPPTPVSAEPEIVDDEEPLFAVVAEVIDETSDTDELTIVDADTEPELPVETEPEHVDEEEPVVLVDDAPAVVDITETIDTEHNEQELQRQDELGATSGATPALRTRITDSPLAMLGLPVPYIPTMPETTKLSALQKALAVSLENLPKAPAIRPSKGAVIAVVGARDEAMQLAEDLAHQWGRPKEEVVLASQHHKGKGSSGVVRSVRAAEDSRRSWSRRDRPTIVVIEAQMGSKSTQWAEHILTALEPIATYGTVEATRKAEDIAAWAVALGGIDCLAVNHVEETVSPASVLATGIAVERIDGRKATPAYWAMLLTERLSAA